MSKLGLGNSLNRSNLVTPGIVTDNLVLKHKYDAGEVVPVSDGATYFISTSHNEIQIADSASLSPSSITVSAWVHFGGVNQPDRYARIIDTDGGSKSWHLRYTNDTNIFCLRVCADGTNHELVQTDTTYTDYTKWYHVTGTYNHITGDGKVYVDGVHDGTDNLSGAGALNDVSSVIHIGSATSDGNTFWNGYICNVGVWSEVLTQAQIKSIMWKNYAGLSDSEKTNLVSWWNLDSVLAEPVTTGASLIKGSDEFTMDSKATLGSNMVTNGDMEVDSGWSKYGDSSTTYALSTEQVYGGTYSRKVVPATADDGIRSAVYTTSLGKVYKISVRVYVTGADSASNFRIKPFDGDGNQSDTPAAFDFTLTEDQWNYIEIYYNDTTGGSSASVVFTSRAASAGTWYIDDVSVQEYSGNNGILI